MNLRNGHAILFLQHMVWQEGYLNGQLNLCTQGDKAAITDEQAAPVTWDGWMQRKSSWPSRTVSLGILVASPSDSRGLVVSRQLDLPQLPDDLTPERSGLATHWRVIRLEPVECGADSCRDLLSHRSLLTFDTNADRFGVEIRHYAAAIENRSSTRDARPTDPSHAPERINARLVYLRADSADFTRRAAG